MASSSSLRPPLISSRSLSSPSLPSFFFHPSRSRSRSLLFPKPLLSLSFPSSPSPSPSPSPSSSSSSSLRTHRVSTAPVEQAPAPEFGFGDEIARLGALSSQLRGARSLDEKLRVLDADSRVGEFFGNGNGGVLGELESLEVYLLKCLVAAGQGHVLGSELDWGGGGGGGYRVEGSALRSALYTLADLVEKWSLHGHASGIVDDGVGGLGIGEMELLRKLLKILGEIEQFYDCIGGIIG